MELINISHFKITILIPRCGSPYLSRGLCFSFHSQPLSEPTGSGTAGGFV